MKNSGWIIDAWNQEEEITIWIKSDQNENIFLTDIFHPRIHARCHDQKGKALLWKLIRENILSFPAASTQKELWTGKAIPVHSLLVLNQSRFRTILFQADRWKSSLEFYNTDILPVHGYFMEKDLFPLARIEFIPDETRIREIIRISKNTEIFSNNPPLTSLLLGFPSGRLLPPGNQNPLMIQLSRSEEINLSGSPLDIITGLNEILKQEDPDIIFTSEGDDFIMPFLFQTAEKHQTRLLLDRSPVHYTRSSVTRKKSFFSYGRVVYKTTPFPLFGRLHIDRGQSFFYSETDLEGIFEMSRLSRLTIQKLGRASPGSAMSAMEDETAIQTGTLIPRIKGKSSSIKPLRELLRTDQGGMSYRPPTGIFENVAELDFRSLYPNLMYGKNISGETVNCKCCANSGIKVPETSYHTCGRRRGIVPETIQMLLERRDILKNILASEKLSAAETEVIELKSSALKWCLVTSFGYTGYKNAKYGRREAHEAITAWGRFAIQTAKECAERRGYKLLHSLTDSLWLQGDIRQDAIDSLCEEISNETGVRIFHEMSYSWIVFTRSKKGDEHSVATRYFGRGDNGKMKIRGTFTRKKDTPLFIKQFQQSLFEQLSFCRTPFEIKQSMDSLNQIKTDILRLLQSEKIDPKELAVKKSLSRSTGEYQGNNPTSVVLKHLEKSGINYTAGQSVRYIACDVNSKNPENRYIPLNLFKEKFDFGFYKNLIEDAFLEVTDFFQASEECLFIGRKI